MPELETDQTIIVRIQKLLSLANSSNEAEAALAMARAQAMLAKHNLDFALVKDAYVEGGTNPAPEEKREKTRIAKRSAKYVWQRALWKALSEANFCWYSTVEVYEQKWGRQTKVPVKRHMILGRESNVIAVRIMGEYLEDTLERTLPYPNGERHSRSAISWKRGAADRLCERVRAEAERRKKESDKNKPKDSTALVLRDVYQREYEGNYDARYGAGSYQRQLAADAEWEAGKEQREKEAREAELKAEADWIIYLQNETPAQMRERMRQLAKEEKAEERSWRSKRYKIETDNLDTEAYRSGVRAGEKINLSSQIKDSGDKAILI